MSKWFVYVDWTLEDVPRPFYVGKGNCHRVLHISRNKKHARIAAVYGFRREIVLMTSVEQITFDREKNLIAEYKTYVYDNQDRWGANFTRGGEGTSGHKQSLETRQKIREWRLGKTFSHTEATKLKMSLAKKGRPSNTAGKRLSDETRRKMSEFQKGRPKTEEWKLMMSERMKGNKNGSKKEKERG